MADLLGMGNPLLDISAVVPQEVLDKYKVRHPFRPPPFRRLTAQVWNPGARQLVAIAFVVSRTLTGAEIRRATGVFDRCPRMCKRVVLLIDQCSPFSPPQLTSSPHSNQEVIKTDY